MNRKPTSRQRRRAAEARKAVMVQVGCVALVVVGGVVAACVGFLMSGGL